MKSITIRLAVFAVVLSVALSMLAAPAVAAPGDKVTVMPGDNISDGVPGQGADYFPDSLFDGIPGQGADYFPDFLFDGGDQDGSDPVITT